MKKKTDMNSLIIKYLPFQVIPTAWTDYLLERAYTRNNVIVELNGSGNIKRLLHDPEGRLHHPTEVQDDGRNLYISSIVNDFIARVRL